MLKPIKPLIRLFSGYKLIKNISFFLFPGCCVLCGSESDRVIDLCYHCESDLPHNNQCCIRCSIPLINNDQSGTLCGECIAHPPIFDQCLAPLRYEFPVSALISRYKYQGHFCSGAVLADILLTKLFKDQIRDQNKKPDLIVPVPLHRQRQFFRGFNQSQWLAQYLSRELNVPVDAYLLKRCRKTPPQQGLKRKQRQKNLKGAFQVNRPIEGKHIALVDDVVTTGSTVSELAQLLKKAGATKVEIWCLARTPLEK